MESNPKILQSSETYPRHRDEHEKLMQMITRIDTNDTKTTDLRKKAVMENMIWQRIVVSNADGRYLLLDKHGNSISKQHYGYKQRNERLEFIVTRDGEIISKSNPEFAMLVYFDDALDRSRYAPGRPYDIQCCSDGTLVMNFEWLLSDDMYAQATPSNFTSEEKSSLPFRSFCMNLRHLAPCVQKTYMPHYAKILQEASHCIAPKNSQFIFTMHNYLEMYYIRPVWIWLSHIGQFFWNVLIQPLLSFLKQECTLQHIFNAQHYQIFYFDVETTQKTTCCQICGQQFEFPLNTLLVLSIKQDVRNYICDKTCLTKMQFLHCIRKFIENIRSEPLHIDNLLKFEPFLKDMQHRLSFML